MLTLMEAERAFQLDPPPEPESEGFAAFLHFYEPHLNERVRRFLGKRAFDAETLLEYKLACAAAMLERWKAFDPPRRAECSAQGADARGSGLVFKS